MRPGIAAVAVAAVLGFGLTGAGQPAEFSWPEPAAPCIGPCPAGGFALTGTGGCLFVGGALQAEGAWRTLPAAFGITLPPSGIATAAARPGAAFDQTAFGATARLTADLRLPTELGPLRVFVSLRGRHGAAPDRMAR